MRSQREYFTAGGVRYGYLTWGENPQEPCRARLAQPRKSSVRREGPPSQPCEVLSPVLLVHGFAQSARAWGKVARMLATDRSVYALDLVGHGESDKPAGAVAYRLPEMGRALLAFAESLAAPPLVVGYSLGGRVALSALVAAGAEAFASCTSGLILESAGLGMPTERDRMAAVERDAATARRLREQSLREFMTDWENLPLFESQKALPPHVREAVRAGRLANDPEALAKSVEQAGQHAMPARSEILSALRLLVDRGYPVLYVAGEMDGKYAGLAAELAEETEGSVPVRLVSDAGHNVHLEAPDALVECVRSGV